MNKTELSYIANCKKFFILVTKPIIKNMLEFCKKVLEKVSFDQNLFKKELLKAIKWVKTDELEVLRRWCLIKFGNLYRSVIEDSFQQAIPA